MGHRASKTAPGSADTHREGTRPKRGNPSAPLYAELIGTGLFASKVETRSEPAFTERGERVSPRRGEPSLGWTEPDVEDPDVEEQRFAG